MRGRIFGLVEIIFGIVYLGLGLLLTLGPSTLIPIGRSMQTALGVLLIAYGLFRFYRFSRRWRKHEDNDEDDAR